MEQMHFRNSFKPVLPTNLSKEEKQKVIESLMFKKEKRDGTMKARTCADGWKQCEDPDYNKGDNASPTVSTEAVMLTAVTEAKEGRDVATVDLPNFFIQTPQLDDDKVVMHLRGGLAELMVLIAPELYIPFVILENGKKF